MRLLIAGSLNGQLSMATKIALDRGAQVSHTETMQLALSHLRAGRGADLMMVDVNLDIAHLIQSLENEHITVPVVACA
ncbi:MAG TPA: sigma-54-dependent Fis family transcriptional regulator, partial [Rhizobiales bacterium]|nr:sigma-54-dependent Fis family transcriptional regulator [Hyphomicrobiales bacterium]